MFLLFLLNSSSFAAWHFQFVKISRVNEVNSPRVGAHNSRRRLAAVRGTTASRLASWSSAEEEEEEDTNIEARCVDGGIFKTQIIVAVAAGTANLQDIGF